MSMDGFHCSCDPAMPRGKHDQRPCPIHGEKGKVEWDQLESAVAALRQERDELREHAEKYHRDFGDVVDARYRAEAQLAEAREGPTWDEYEELGKALFEARAEVERRARDARMVADKTGHPVAEGAAVELEKLHATLAPTPDEG